MLHLPMDPTALKDTIDSAKTGSFEAFERLVDTFRHQVYGLARRLLQDEAEAADVAQETFFSAWKNLATYENSSPFKSWLLTIAANESLGRLRKRKVRQRFEEPRFPQFNERESLIENVADFAPQSEDLALRQELREAIEAASSSLSPEYREVFLLRDIEGLSYEEVSRVTGLAMPNVKTRLHRARLAMRRSLNEFYEEKSV
jgi:RNA polymerase sigma-70 factor, ECF subfamily